MMGVHVRNKEVYDLNIKRIYHFDEFTLEKRTLNWYIDIIK